MRSVVVVLPASMWAMIPMLRVLESVFCGMRFEQRKRALRAHERRTGRPGAGV
jgi:hypothetical protein